MNATNATMQETAAKVTELTDRERMAALCFAEGLRAAALLSKTEGK